MPALRPAARPLAGLIGAIASLALLTGCTGTEIAAAPAGARTAVIERPAADVVFATLTRAREAGKFKQARESYEKAIDLDDKYAAATLNLGILNDLYLAEPDRALSLYERYLVLTPAGDATVTKWIADLKNRKGAAAKDAKKEKE